ncbi:MAG: hypothetical protein QG626_240 [Patescibacteria group bacterium]|nr:hypothetical protein [Patescibacteria group bacterium]
MSSKDRCLFLSFSGAVRMLRDRRIKRADFRNALFWVGCTRDVVTGSIEEGARQSLWSHLYTPGKKTRPDHRRMFPFYVFVRESVLMAEKEGRVVWRERDSGDRVESIEALLGRCGYNTAAVYEDVVKQIDPYYEPLFGWSRDEAFRRHDMVGRFSWQLLDPQLRVYSSYVMYP